MEYLIYTIVAAVAFWLGWHVRLIVMIAHLSVDPDKMIKLLEKVKEINATQTDEELEQLIKKETNLEQEIDIERVGNVLYAYSKENGQFLAQGSTLADLLDSVHKRFPNKKFFGTISKDNPAKELA